MTSKIKRDNAGILPWLRAVAFAGVTYAALASTGFYPPAVTAILALVAGALGMLAPGIGVLVFVFGLSLPLAAGDLIVGGLFLVLGFSTIAFLGEDDARAFLFVALAYAACVLPGAFGWGVAILAGYLMGPGEGAIVAFLACLVIETAGWLLGRGSLGPLAIGAKEPIVDLRAVAALGEAGRALTFAWIGPAVEAVEPGRYLSSLTSLAHVTLFVIQPFLWAGAAAITGLLRRPVSDPKRSVMGLVATGVGVGVLAACSIAAMVAFGGPVGLPELLLATLASIAVALGGAALSEWVFTPKASVAAAPAARGVTAAAEDADVDELLRMISTAEEELTTKHTVRRIVMITDMKAFSQMTQEKGSVLTAKLVQRHRDLCLPVIQKHGGAGKSSGGDGLIAAFTEAGPAMAAAVEIQQVLDAYNAGRPGDDAVIVRAGIAEGEIVLDKGGKPFLGDALNLAARVMGLADGGQVFTARAVAEAAGALPYGSFSHGSFLLKNIAEPVEIIEILWREGQLAARPAGAALAAETTAAPDAPVDDTPTLGPTKEGSTG